MSAVRAAGWEGAGYAGSLYPLYREPGRPALARAA